MEPRLNNAGHGLRRSCRVRGSQIHRSWLMNFSLQSDSGRWGVLWHLSWLRRRLPLKWQNMPSILWHRTNLELSDSEDSTLLLFVTAINKQLKL